MKPYGVDPRRDQDCCPGHSRYPRSTYNNRRSKAAQTRDTGVAHRAERRTIRQALKAAGNG
jgi:hypothetical protein